MGVVKLSTAGIRNYSKTSNFLSGNAPLSLGSFDLLETTTLSSSASSVTFSGLGAYSDYKHLQIRGVVRAPTDNLFMRVNGVSTTDYAYHKIRGNGSTVTSSASSSSNQIAIAEISSTGEAAGIYSAMVLDVLDFGSSSKNTTFRSLHGKTGAGNRIGLSSGLFNSTAAVTSLEFYADTDMVSGVRFALYGVK
jgi:hypothetical protein